jgi:hypothetical protein
VVECILPGRRIRRRTGIRMLTVPLYDDVEHLGDVPCTTAVRTATDLAFRLPRPLALAAVDAMAHQAMFTPEELLTEVERWPRRPGFRRAIRLAGHCDPLAESAGESWMRLRMLDAGFQRPVAQVTLGNDRQEFRLDLGYPWHRLGVEYDGVEFHSTAEALRHDENRRTKIRDEYGWTVLVANRGDILGRSLRFEQAVGEALGRAPRHSRRTW